MSPVTPFPDQDAAREQACEWIARAFRGLTPEESAQLREWARRPVNRRAMTEMSDVWQGLDVLAVFADLFPREGGAAPQPQAARVRAPVVRYAGIAAGVVAAAVAGWLWLAPGARSSAPPPQASVSPAAQTLSYASAVGEHRTIPLADGSRLALNSDTAVEVSLSPQQRTLRLLHGEAHFDVAHDAARPFVVQIDSRSVRAVGTAFNVRRRAADAVDVLVTEGIVAAPTGERLQAGQLLRIAGDGSRAVRTLDGKSIDALTAWRRGVLVLDGITLGEAMDELQRYTTRRIRVDDADLRALRLGGSFPTNDLAGILRALAANFGVEAKEDAAGTLLLQRARPPAGVPDA